MPAFYIRKHRKAKKYPETEIKRPLFTNKILFLRKHYICPKENSLSYIYYFIRVEENLKAHFLKREKKILNSGLFKNVKQKWA